METNITKEELISRIKQEYSSHPIDMYCLEKNLNDVFLKIENEKLPKSEREIILNRLSCLSPRRTGTFLEVFNRENNNLDKAKKHIT